MSLDVELMRKLHKLGELTVYRVVHFDRATFTVKHGRPTFSERAALAECEAYNEHGGIADVKKLFVRFDDAFSGETLT